ncbi:MAG TPA: sporulation protein YunB [Firmicutes bacterium]|nr:sporulation protein YunB [Bacillota bacterium]
MIRRTWIRRRRLIAGAFLALLLGFLIFVVIDRRLKPTLQQIAEAKARVIATEAINEAVSRKVVGTIKWEDLYALRPDSRGRVVLVQPNTGEISRLTSDVAMAVQDTLKKVTETEIWIPLGQAFGSQILANVGPRICISVVPMGTVRTEISSKFEQAGINQIRHRIYLDVIAHVKIVVPLVSSDIEVRSQVPITEVMIMGEVPQVYFGIEGSRNNNNGQASGK